MHLTGPRVRRAVMELGAAFVRFGAPSPSPREQDPYHAIFAQFVEQLSHREGSRILELGSRDVSGSGTKRSSFVNAAQYVGFDAYPGPGVDIVGDIHQLSRHFPRPEFNGVFSISVFEHLAMPWKAVLEINRVLCVGGLLFVATHSSWPAHERPWDFWRFSRDAFKVLLNKATGFELIACDEGLPCSIVPHGGEASSRGLVSQEANLGVSVLAHKLGDPSPALSWDVRTEEILSTSYPAPPELLDKQSLSDSQKGATAQRR
jgi:hypothetical protein